MHREGCPNHSCELLDVFMVEILNRVGSWNSGLANLALGFSSQLGTSVPTSKGLQNGRKRNHCSLGGWRHPGLFQRRRQRGTGTYLQTNRQMHPSDSLAFAVRGVNKGRGTAAVRDAFAKKSL